MIHLVRETRAIVAYRGGEGHWAYLLHRLTGVGVAFFLLVHILDTALALSGPVLYNKALELYRHPIFRAGEISLFAAVVFHALNGIRIILVDFWPAGTRHQRKIFWIEIGLFAAIMAVVGTVMVRDIILHMRLS